MIKIPVLRRKTTTRNFARQYEVNFEPDGELWPEIHVQSLVPGPVYVHVEFIPQPPLLVAQLLIAVQFLPFPTHEKVERAG